MRTYRVGFLGFGFIGKVHAHGYLDLPLFYDPMPLKARMTHVVTGHSESAERGRQAIGADVATTDYREVTENPDIDIVHICTPNHLHKDALLSAMRHGKHIYCDKPLTATLDEAREIEAALDDYHGTAQMTFQYRFYPATLRAKQLIDEGAIGQVLSFRGCFLHGGSADPKAPLKWKLSAAAGGGVIGDLASHVLDLTDHMIGPFASLTAATKIAFPERPSVYDPTRMMKVDAEDTVTIMARTASGALGTIEATKLATGSEDELRLEIHGTHGALRFNGMDPHHLKFHDATVAEKPCGGLRGWNRIATGQRYEPPANGFPSAKAAMGWTRTHTACLANFLQAIAKGRPAEPGLRQGIRVQHLIECTHRSAEEGSWVEV